jgi:hypothetical protein
MGLPEDEEGLIVMPIGYPTHSYNFKYRPMWVSLLPKIEQSTMSLFSAINNRQETITFNGTISRKHRSQLLWSAYGFSYFVDRSEQELNSIKRHRTVPSAHGYYPLHFYAVTPTGIYKYQPNFLTKFYPIPADFLGLPIITFMYKIKFGNFRTEISNATDMASISEAPLTIIAVLDLELAKDLAAEYLWKFWYYEAGAAAHNIMLEATTFGYKTNLVFPTNADFIGNMLNLNNSCFPMLLIPIGQ